MATGSTLYTFEIVLSDSNRDIYERLSIKIAQHPSETIEYLVCRLLAYCLEYNESLEFTKGLSDPDMPAIWSHDLTGQLTSWIEIGAPSADKIHKASKSVERIAIYTHKNPNLTLQLLAGKSLHRFEQIEIYSFEPKFIDSVCIVTDRRNSWALTINEGEIYLDVKTDTLSSTLHRHTL